MSGSCFYWSRMALALVAVLPLLVAVLPLVVAGAHLPEKMLGMYLSVADDTVPGYLFI